MVRQAVGDAYALAEAAAASLPDRLRGPRALLVRGRSRSSAAEAVDASGAAFTAAL